ncbi:MAG TPA: NAD(+) synthase [Flavobacteriales bacterium]|nr:NAD(+) synthase [Flavobacteriales bacterium]HMR28674.1 NAD(+) synthase [Flavobacteriales bacterium]
MDSIGIADHITGWLKDQCARTGQQGFVVGVSGGVDSALTSTLCARTGLPTLCVEMPIYQAHAQVQRAQDHISWLRARHPNVRMEVVDLTPVFDQLIASLPSFPDQAVMELAQANARARLRMTTLYYFAGLLRHLVAGTGNKVEDFGVGFFTKYGDGGVDLSPIADLTKTEVVAVARSLGVIDSILQAKPTDGLWGDDRSDEDQIGASYPELEWAMDLRERSTDPLTLELTPRQREVLAIYDRRNAANRHKMEPIPVCSVPAGLKS